MNNLEQDLSNNPEEAGREDEAVQWAIDECLRNRHQLRRGGFFNEYVESCAKLLRNAGELGLGAAEIPWCGTDEEVIDLIKEARDGAEAAQKILLELAAATIERAQELSGPLKEL